MSHWTKITANSHNQGGYVNLDTAYAIAVVPTIADPTKFVLVVYQTEGGEPDTIVTVPDHWTSVADALTAARQLLGSFEIIGD